MIVYGNNVVLSKEAPNNAMILPVPLKDGAEIQPVDLSAYPKVRRKEEKEDVIASLTACHSSLMIWEIAFPSTERRAWI